MTLDLKRIMARDRRLAAIHEAGHVTMARHLGALFAVAWLEKAAGTADSDVRFEKLWTGHTNYYFHKTPSRRKIAMFAVAGAVAEHCWQRISFDDALDSWDEPEVMSESDWAGTGCTPGEPSSNLLRIIEHTFSLFDSETGILWPALIKEARWLMDTRDARTFKPRSYRPHLHRSETHLTDR
jgi:hypothetical protein